MQNEIEIDGKELIEPIIIYFPAYFPMQFERAIFWRAASIGDSINWIGRPNRKSSQIGTYESKFRQHAWTKRKIIKRIVSPQIE